MPADPGAVRLPKAVSAALAGLAAECGTDAGAVALAGAGLLLRRYTGRAEHVIWWRSADAGGFAAVDLTDDGPIRALVAAVGTAMHPAPQVLAGPPARPQPVGPPPIGEEPFADGAAVELMLDGPEWTISVTDCPRDLVPFVTEDLAALFAQLAVDAGRSTADLLAVSAYERASAPDLAALHTRPVAGVAQVAAVPPRTTPDQEEGTLVAPQPTWGFAAEATISSAFAAQVARHPDRPAVLADDACLTYRELGSAVCATAREIRQAARDTDRPGRVAVLCRHGATTVIGLLGALATGRAYVPLDPAFPAQRLALILADARADVLLIDADHADLAARLIASTGLADLPTVHIAHPVDAAPAEIQAALASPARPDDPAYLLYTSGSTGAPKGVVQSHRNVLFGVANHVRNFAITPHDRTSVLTSFGYDMAVTDTFSAILSGAAAVPADIRTRGLGHLAETLTRHGVTIYHSTPTVYRYLLASLGDDGRLPGIRAVLLGGEEVTRHDVELAREHFGPQTVFVNGYGTTEISFAAQSHLPPGAPLHHAVVPIGQPLPGIDVVLAGAGGRPACLTGEIVVRCPHVALGYWGLPELTGTRFVELDGVRAYRTGDLARRLPDGTLLYLGRADRMVKIRGYRVELGEVEARLAALPGVGHAAVIARDSLHQEKELIGYAVPARGATLEPAAVRAELAASLPDFMLPRAVVILDALPIGPTGKLDHAALPAPAGPPSGADGAARDTGIEPDTPAADPLASAVRTSDASSPTAPSPDGLEQAIAAAWCAVLRVERVDHGTSFFQVGGHSLLMALIQQRLERELGRRLPLALLFEHATVAGLAAHLRAADRSTATVDRATDRMRRRRQARHGADETIGTAS